MIKTTVDYEYALSQLIQPITLDIGLQDDILDSDNINLTFKSIEKNLNILYEKTRYLEDIIDYVKAFLNAKIDSYYNSLISIINSINDIKKISKNMGYIEYNVPFKKNIYSIQDRGKNYKVEPCNIKEYNGKNIRTNLLILDNRICTTYDYNSITKKCDQIAYDSNFSIYFNDKKYITQGFNYNEDYNDLHKQDIYDYNSIFAQDEEEYKLLTAESKNLDEEYKTIYIEESPVKNGIKEEITIFLKEPFEVNELKINSVNSYVDNIRYTYPNGIEERSINNLTGIELESRVVTSIKFDLICKNYNIVVYELDSSLVTDTIWTTLSKFESGNYDIEDKLSMQVLISRTQTDSNNNRTYTAYREAPNKTTKAVMYTYSFGIDELEINRIVQYEDGYFISDPINLGDFNNEEYIQLSVDDNYESNSSIEYYILDGDIEIPIMPIEYNYIVNERIFPENDLRFTVDYDVYGDGLKQIKKDGLNVNISLDDAKVQYDGRYSADYQPTLKFYNYTPINSSIRVKAIIRTFGDNYSTIPYIKNINIRKFGGNTLWTTLY